MKEVRSENELAGTRSAGGCLDGAYKG